MYYFRFFYSFASPQKESVAAYYTKAITFTESTAKNQTKAVNIPNLGKVLNITVDDGVVSYSKSRDELRVTVKNGN